MNSYTFVDYLSHTKPAPIINYLTNNINTKKKQCKKKRSKHLKVQINETNSK